MRAIAVLGVLLFHADPDWVPGGYVGVDVFFVISGYLITGNIIRDARSGRFSFGDFYRHRIRRILPAVLFVTLATLIAGHFILLPEDLVRLSESAIASAFSVANVYFAFFLDTSYFAPNAAHQPLLHLWSLGVEEQFYLLWPACLVLCLRLSRPFRVAFVIVTIAASFALAQQLLANHPMFAYYMLPTRAGQLLAGAFCVMALEQVRARCAMPAAVILQGAGLLLVLGSMLLLDDESAFPGINAVPVTLGTALLLTAGGIGGIFDRILSLPPLRWIGWISYSLYLWHWPVFAFARYVHGEIDLVYKLVAIALILGLSHLSFRWVETPFRRSAAPLPALALRQFALPAGLITAVAAAFIGSQGLGLYGLSEEYRSALLSSPQRAGDESYVCQRTRVTPGYMRQPECIIGADFSGTEAQSLSDREPDVLLWGDSNAAHYVGFIGEQAYRYRFAFRNVAHGLCLPLLDRPERFSPADRARDCRRSARAVQNRLWLYDTIILGGAWHRPIEKFPDFLPALEQTVQTLIDEGKHVILLGRVPYIEAVDSECGKKALKLAFISCRERSSTPLIAVEEYNGRLRDIARRTGAAYYDITALTCRDSVCSSYLGNDQLYRDPGHLGLEASIRLGQLAADDHDAAATFSALAGKLGGGTFRPPPWRSEGLALQSDERVGRSTEQAALDPTGQVPGARAHLPQLD